MQNKSGATPVGYRILIKPRNPIASGDEEKEKDSVIIIPDEVKKREGAAADVGTVIELGSVAYKREDFGYDPWVQPGDVILFSRYAGQVFISPLDNSEYRILNDEDVIMKFSEEAAAKLNKKSKE